MPTPKFTFPEPVVWDAKLSDASKPGELVHIVPCVNTVSGALLRIEVFDRRVAKRVGAAGFVFRVSEVPTEPGVFSRAAAAGGLPAELSIDYSSFANAYGAGFVDRLRVVALHGCVLQDPLPRDCDTASKAMPSRNDLATHRLLADHQNLADDLGAVYAVTAAASGDQGTFAATPLSMASFLAGGTGVW